MERYSIHRKVDEIIVDRTAFEGFNFPRNELTVEVILGWLPSDLINEPQLTIVTERANQWVNPPILAHLPDPRFFSDPMWQISAYVRFSSKSRGASCHVGERANQRI
jgi:hypothetical protein